MLLCPGTRCYCRLSKTVHQTRVRLPQINREHKLEATARQARERFLRSTTYERYRRHEEEERKRKQVSTKLIDVAQGSEGEAPLIAVHSNSQARGLQHVT